MHVPSKYYHVANNVKERFVFIKSVLFMDKLKKRLDHHTSGKNIVQQNPFHLQIKDQVWTSHFRGKNILSRMYNCLELVPTLVLFHILKNTTL